MYKHYVWKVSSRSLSSDWIIKISHYIQSIIRFQRRCFTFLFLEGDESFASFQHKGRSLDDGEDSPDILILMLFFIALIFLVVFDAGESHSFLRDLSFDL